MHGLWELRWHSMVLRTGRMTVLNSKPTRSISMNRQPLLVLLPTSVNCYQLTIEYSDWLGGYDSYNGGPRIEP